MLYDREQFKAMKSTVPAAVATDADFMTQIALPNTPAVVAAEEQNEELWLDNNTMPLVINRYNGTLIKGE